MVTMTHEYSLGDEEKIHGREPIYHVIREVRSQRLHILDMGCGSGEYIHWREHGWDSQGIEISATAVKNARGVGLNVRQTMLLEAGFPSDQFDLITAWEVLEHLP